METGSIEFPLAQSDWFDGTNTYTITQDYTVPPSADFRGVWTHSLGTTTIDPGDTVFDFAMPNEVSGAVGSWTRTGVDTQSWSLVNASFHQYVYDTIRTILFQDFDAMQVIRFPEHGPR